MACIFYVVIISITLSNTLKFRGASDMRLKLDNCVCLFAGTSWHFLSLQDQIKNSDKKNNSGTIKNPLKQILLYFGRGNWNDLPMGQTKFFDDNCPVNSCSLTINQKDAAVADAILYKDRFAWPKVARPVNQLWILFLLECPLHTQMISKLDRELFNLTATYRHDSDIVTPYEKWITYNRKEKVETQVRRHPFV